MKSIRGNCYDKGYVWLLKRVDFVKFVPIVMCNDDNGVVEVSLLGDFSPFDDLWYGIDVGNVSVAMPYHWVLKVGPRDPKIWSLVW